jgi:thioredoxin 1
MTQSLTEQTYDEALTAAEGLVMVDFWAPWCGPCRAVAPVLEQLADEADVTLMKVNIDENPGLASRYGIRSIPTILFVKDGEVVEQVIGAASKAAFQKVIAKHTAE